MPLPDINRKIEAIKKNWGMGVILQLYKKRAYMYVIVLL